MNRDLISVVIPAHDEEAVIQRTLGALLRSADPGEFEVIVVCNGCSDATAE
ncbi:MAG: glycosyltransferase, partial [Gammaproteobacteria bacterium]